MIKHVMWTKLNPFTKEDDTLVGPGSYGVVVPVFSLFNFSELLEYKRSVRDGVGTWEARKQWFGVECVVVDRVHIIRLKRYTL